MEKIEFGHTYHIFNRANGNDKLFREDENYRFFLTKCEQYILPIAQIMAFCLMPNHFHFILRFKEEKAVRKAFPKFETLEKLEPAFLSKQLSNLFSSYTQAFNKVYGRKGSLFMKNFKRKRVGDEQYLIKLIHYIHLNPVEAALTRRPNEWKFSSYNWIIGKSTSFVQSQSVLSYFENLQNFKACHKFPPQLTGVENY